MKKVLTILSVLIILIDSHSYATTYYFAANGNDANAGNIAAPWATIAKFNSIFPSRLPGDNILFRRGDVFVGTIAISRAGTLGNPITIGAYGTGAQPLFSGFTTVTGWTNLGGNIWESNTVSTGLSTCNMVTINGVNTGMGRTPNTGFYIYSAHGGSGSTSTLTSSSLNASAINWATPSAGAPTGAELAFYPTTYIVDRFPITAASGTSITYNATSTVLFQAASSYFIQNFIIQNDPRTLDVQNEWYYNPTTKKLRIFSSSMPTNVRMATTQQLVTWASFADFVTISDLAFEGSNGNAITQGGLKNSIVDGCTFNYIGGNGVYGQPFGGARTFINNRIRNCYFNQIQNIAIGQNEAYIITGNTIRNVGKLIGMSTPFTSSLTTFQNCIATGIRVVEDSSIVMYNNLDSIGGAGINWFNHRSRTSHNFVNHTCLIIKDLGGIYMWNGGTSPLTISGAQVDSNIVLNSGTGSSSGIYFDTKGNGTAVFGNTSAFAEWCMLSGDQTYNLNINHNTFFDPNSTTSSSSVACLQIDTRANNPSNNFIVKNNIFFAKTANQFCFWTLNAGVPTMPTPFTSDSNYFLRPINDNLTIQTYLGGPNTQRSLAMWQTFSGQDAHSLKSPLTINNINQIAFYYNPTDHDSTVSVINGVDATNTAFSGTTVIHSFQSLILISTGSLTTPTITWGPLTAITYETLISSTQLSASTGIAGTFSYSIGGTPLAIGTKLPAGTYTVTVLFTPTDGATYTTATKSVTLVVNPKPVTLSFFNLSQAFTGGLLLPTITTNPAGVAYSITLDGVTGGKIDVNNYTAVGGIIDPNYTASTITATFTITKQVLTINASSKTVNFDGNQQTITATTTPVVSGFTLTYLYDDDPTPPSAIGVYDVAISGSDANHQATTVHVTLTIVNNPAIIFISDSLTTYNHSPQGVTVTSAYTYDLTGSPQTDAGSYQVIAHINDGVHVGSDTATFIIAKRDAVLSWTTPTAIPAGSQLTTAMLTASADEPGTWTYDYPVGTVLPIGTTTVTGTFVPDDPANINGGTVSVNISVFGANQILNYFISGPDGRFFFIEQ